MISLADALIFYWLMRMAQNIEASSVGWRLQKYQFRIESDRLDLNSATNMNSSELLSKLILFLYVFYCCKLNRKLRTKSSSDKTLKSENPFIISNRHLILINSFIISQFDIQLLIKQFRSRLFTLIVSLDARETDNFRMKNQFHVSTDQLNAKFYSLLTREKIIFTRSKIIKNFFKTRGQWLIWLHLHLNCNKFWREEIILIKS